MCSSLEKITSPAHSLIQLYVVRGVGLWLPGLSPSTLSCPLSILSIIFCIPAVRLLRLDWYSFWYYQEIQSPSKHPDSLALIDFPLYSSTVFPEPYIWKCCVDILFGNGLQKAAFWLLWFSMVLSVSKGTSELELALVLPPWRLAFMTPKGAMKVSIWGRLTTVLPS